MQEAMRGFRKPRFGIFHEVSSCPKYKKAARGLNPALADGEKHGVSRRAAKGSNVTNFPLVMQIQVCLTLFFPCFIMQAY
jgi:hypothetical protein